MKTVQELYDELGVLTTRAREFIDALTDDSTEAEVSEAESKFDEIMQKRDGVEKQYQRAKKLEDQEYEHEQRQLEAEERAKRRRPADNGEVDPDPGEKRDYDTVFRRYLAYGFQELDKEERQILRDGGRNLPSDLSPEIRALAVGTDSAGGYTVPTILVNELERTMLDWGPMYDGNVVRELVTTTGAEMDWPTIDDTAKTGRIKAENADVDDDGTDDPAFGEKKLNAYVYDTGMVRVPIELLQDSIFDMENLLPDLFAERLGRLANNVLTVADGSAKPNGVVTASALGITAASATAITSDETLNMFHSLNAAYRRSPKCRWMFADTTLLALRKLKDGDGNYLWQMGDIRNGEPNTFHAKPYSINDDVPAIATGTKPIIFGDFNKYIVRKVRGFQTLTLRERYAEKFQVGMVAYKRFDGELTNTAAMKHLIMA